MVIEPWTQKREILAKGHIGRAQRKNFKQIAMANQYKQSTYVTLVSVDDMEIS